MFWKYGEVFRCTGSDCGGELMVTYVNPRKAGAVLPTCFCCGRVMTLKVPEKVTERNQPG